MQAALPPPSGTDADANIRINGNSGEQDEMKDGREDDGRLKSSSTPSRPTDAREGVVSSLVGMFGGMTDNIGLLSPRLRLAPVADVDAESDPRGGELVC